jgi:hypothetical protein
LAWYSWIFIWTFPKTLSGEFYSSPALVVGIPYTKRTATLKTFSPRQGAKAE